MSKPRRTPRPEDSTSSPTPSSSSGHKKSSSSSSSLTPSSSSSKPSPSPSSTSSASTADFLRTDDVLQAVLLADSFTIKFRPISLERPKVLIPLLNLPLLDYALEFLTSGGVQELFVFCCSHSAAISSHISASRILKRSPSCTVRVVVSRECYSVGDALRHLDTLDLIKGDFVLMSGDVVTNLPLPQLVQQHRERVRQDKNTLMTLVMKQAAPGHPIRAVDDDTVVALVPDTQQLLLYQNSFTSPRTPPLHTSAFSSHPCIQFRYDLLDAHLLVCTPQVLLLFTDNFDYQDLRRDFIPGILGQEDILGHTLYLFLLSHHYAVCIGDLHTYAACSAELLHRWAFPYVPDLNLLHDTSYAYARGNRYREADVHVERGVTVGEDTCIGRGTTIGEGSSVVRSVIGRECVIGKRVVVEGSFLWGKVVIEDGVRVDRAVLCDGVVVKRGAVIGRGAILSFGVVVGEGVRVGEGVKLTTARRDDEVFEDDSPHPGDEGGEGEERAWDEAVVGRKGRGEVYHEEKREEEDDEGEEGVRFEGLNSVAVDDEQRSAAWRRKRELEEAAESEDEWDIPEGEAGEEEEEKADAHPTANGVGPTHPAPPPARAPQDEDALPRFYTEAIATLQRGHAEQLPVEAIVLEMASLKLSHDASMLEYVEACILAMLSFVPLPSPSPSTSTSDLTPTTSPSPPSSSSSSSSHPSPELLSLRRAAFTTPSLPILKSLLSILKRWSPVLSKFGRHQAEQVVFIHALVRAVRRWKGVYGGVFAQMLRMLVDNVEVVEEEAVFEWERAYKAEHGAGDALLVQAQPLLTWLREAEEEEDDEEEEDGEEGEEDGEEDDS